MERRVLEAIAVATVASGAAQIALPGVMLRTLGTEDSPAVRQTWATIGMFMTVVGGLSFAGLRQPEQARQVLLWTSAQKLAAAGAVAIGVRRRVFSPLALPVAGFDFASGLLGLHYRSRLGRR
jgi:hypothetical protein